VTSAPPRDTRHERPVAHLGDLLYARDAVGSPAEQQWIDLIQAISEGKHDAMHALYDRANRLVFTVILRIVRQPQLAEEVTVDVFYDVWRRAGAFDPSGGSVIGWLLNQARSRAIDRLRLEQRKKRVNPYPEDPWDSASEPGPEQRADGADLIRTLQRAIAALSVTEREAIESAFFGELSYTEVAKRLGEPVGTIKSRIRSGLTKLRFLLAGSDR
jgi:RNA polymerase sigma-70 factor (ECF subfamily)